MTALPFLDAEAVLALDPPAAMAALRDALAEGLDPSADPPRSMAPVRSGELLVMPSDGPEYAGVKVVSVAPGNSALGVPRIQGIYLLFEARTLTPIALLDGVAMTNVRTAAVSALAASTLAAPDAHRLVVFGTGPQAHAHIAALAAVLPITDVVVVGRSAHGVARFVANWEGRGPTVTAGTAEDVARADVVVCATTASTPLFGAEVLGGDALAIAVGSHQPGVVELDPELLGRAQVVVEESATALREAGEVVAAVAAGVLEPPALVDLSGLVRGNVSVDRTRPRVFKSVGMAWEDRVVAEAVLALQISETGQVRPSGVSR
jgi:ornithine cyclodeaminase